MDNMKVIMHNGIKVNPHALIIAGGDVEKAINISFRNGPCNLCGGDCLCNDDEMLLISRIRSGLKPVGTFVGTDMLKHMGGLHTKVVKNKWGVKMVIATKHKYLTDIVFKAKFYNEKMKDMDKVSFLYGYPTLLEVEQNVINYINNVNLTTREGLKQYNWYYNNLIDTDDQK